MRGSKGMLLYSTTSGHHVDVYAPMKRVKHSIDCRTLNVQTLSNRFESYFQVKIFFFKMGVLFEQ